MKARQQGSPRRGVPPAMQTDREYACFCADAFGTREELITHNVSAHGQDEAESRRAVLAKYPE